MTEIEKIGKLIEDAEEVLRTHTPNPPNVIGFPTLDNKKFEAWKTSCLSFLNRLPIKNNIYMQKFSESIKAPYRGTVDIGEGILQALKNDLEDGTLVLASETSIDEIWAINSIKNIVDKFHLVARQLRVRHDNRATLDIDDEYDVQDLFYALLYQYFDDIRKEEWTPSYAGKSLRMDFLVKDFCIVIEIKKTRKGLNDKELGDQLIEDIARYQSHPNCKVLLCFVYDSEGKIGNPRGIENDLSKKHNELDVQVWIRP